MPPSDTRSRLLAAGLDRIHRNGFAASGVKDITAAAGIPKGSFYNHFESKEGFGVAVVDAYTAARAAAFDLLAAKGLPPGRRIRAHFAAVSASIGGEDTRTGCLVGNLAAEAAPVSEAIRHRLAEAFAAWTLALTECLRDAEATGGLHDAPSPEVLAQILICGWEGAVQRTKVDRSGVPLRAFAALLDRFIPP